MIYFIRAGQTNWIKIGTTRDPEDRLAAIQTGNHEICTLEAVIDGSAKEERRLHSLCDSLRRGEWFELNGRTLIALHLAKNGKTASEIFAELERQRKADWIIRDERMARGVVALRKHMATDDSVPIFMRRWLRMFGIREAERNAAEARRQSLSELRGLGMTLVSMKAA